MKLHEMKQKRATIAGQMRKFNDENSEKRWDDAMTKQWGDMSQELDDLDAAIAREERLLSLDSDELNRDPERRSLLDLDTNVAEARQMQVLDTVLRGGFGELDAEQRQLFKEMRAQTVGTGAEGGFTVPTEFRNRVVEAMKAFGGLANIATVFETDSGNPIIWATTDGTTEEGVMVGEKEESTEQNMVFGQVAIGAKKMTSNIIKISDELLQDSGVDIAGLISRRIGSRLGRGEAKQLLTGDGQGNNIKGLLNQVTGGKTSAASGAVAHADLLTLKHAVDPAYRLATARWLFNDNTLLGLKQMKDGQGRPLWLPDVAGVAPATIDGDQYQIDQGMPDVAANAKAVAYGDFSYFQIRRVKGMELRRLTEKYAEFGLVGFLMFHRFDALLEDKAAVKVLTIKA
ncbi:phage capsid protein [Aeromonas caviae]|uniref:phage major capsid protein n=1 Tax=Aeromonas caviae TaxID=648 RepID=UPI001FB9C561|nr:phage major capsid protein [Aeromonas caviae]BDO09033.1 phage capsid protein [Aeromonas caviae]GKR79835.1 phage capsid protein [Aeromonas caviae]